MKIFNIILLMLSLVLLHCTKPYTTLRHNANLKINKTVYIDKRFSKIEINYIEEALNEWSEKSNNLLQFKVEYNININEKEYIKNKYQSIMIEKTHSSDTEIVFVEKLSETTLIGLCNTSTAPIDVMIIFDRLKNKEEYRSVVIHEIGHALGLKHSDIRWTLMYPYIDSGSYHLTYYDMEQFCKIYSCNVKDLNFKED